MEAQQHLQEQQQQQQKLWGAVREGFDGTDQPATSAGLSGLGAEAGDGSSDLESPFGRMDSAMLTTGVHRSSDAQTADQRAAAAASPHHDSRQAGSPSDAQGPNPFSAATRQQSDAAAWASQPLTDAQLPEGSPLQQALNSGDFEWLGMPGGQQPTIMWPPPAPDGRPRAPIVSWASPLASAPSPFASAAALPFDQLVAGSRQSDDAGASSEAPQPQQQPPAAEPHSVAVAGSGLEPAAVASVDAGRAAGTDVVQADGDDRNGSSSCSAPASPSGPRLHAVLEAQTFDDPDCQSVALQHQQKPAAGGGDVRNAGQLRTSSFNSKTGIASSDSVSSWQCPQGALGSLRATPTGSPHATPPDSPLQSPLHSAPVSPRAQQSAQPSCLPPTQAAADSCSSGGCYSGEQPGQRRRSDADSGGSDSELSGAMAQPPQDAQHFGQRHAASQGSAGCHDVTLPGATPAARQPRSSPMPPLNPFAQRQFSAADASASIEPRPRQPIKVSSPSSRRDSAVDHEQMREKVQRPAAPNPFAQHARPAASPGPRPAMQPANPSSSIAEQATSSTAWPAPVSLGSAGGSVAAGSARKPPPNPFASQASAAEEPQTSQPPAATFALPSDGALALLPPPPASMLQLRQDKQQESSSAASADASGGKAATKQPANPFEHAGRSNWSDQRLVDARPVNPFQNVGGSGWGAEQSAADAKPANPFEAAGQEGWEPRTPQQRPPPPINPFEAERGMDWQAPPERHTLAHEGPAASVAAFGGGFRELWNTDRDIMLPHSLIIKALNTGSTKLTPVETQSAAVQVRSSKLPIMREMSDASSTSGASDSDNPDRGSRPKRRSGGSSSAGGSPPKPSLSTHHLLRGAYAPPDDSPVDLSEAVRRAQPTAPQTMMGVAVGGATPRMPTSPFAAPADSLASLRGEAAGTAPRVVPRRPPVSPFEGASPVGRARMDRARHTDSSSPDSYFNPERDCEACSRGEAEALADLVQCLENAPSSSRSGGSSSRSVASLLADNSFAEWLSTERSRSSSRFGLDSPLSSITPGEAIGPGRRMTSSDLVRAAGQQRTMVAEGRVTSLDRPQQLRGGCGRRSPHLRTNSDAEVSISAMALAGPGPGLAAALAEVSSPLRGNGGGLRRNSISEWRNIMLAGGRERAKLLAFAAARDSRHSSGRNSSRTSIASSDEGDDSHGSPRHGGSGSATGSSSRTGSPRSGSSPSSRLTSSSVRNLAAEGRQRSAESHGGISPRPPLAVPSLRTRPPMPPADASPVVTLPQAQQQPSPWQLELLRHQRQPASASLPSESSDALQPTVPSQPPAPEQSPTPEQQTLLPSSSAAADSRVALPSSGGDDGVRRPSGDAESASSVAGQQAQSPPAASADAPARDGAAAVQLPGKARRLAGDAATAAPGSLQSSIGVSRDTEQQPALPAELPLAQRGSIGGNLSILSEHQLPRSLRIGSLDSHHAPVLPRQVSTLLRGRRRTLRFASDPTLTVPEEPDQEAAAAPAAVAKGLPRGSSSDIDGASSDGSRSAAGSSGDRGASSSFGGFGACSRLLRHGGGRRASFSADSRPLLGPGRHSFPAERQPSGSAEVLSAMSLEAVLADQPASGFATAQALMVNVAARAALLAKAIPDGGDLSPTSIFDRLPSIASTEWSSTTGSRRGSSTGSVASACRAAVIAASLNAAIDSQGVARRGIRRGSNMSAISSSLGSQPSSYLLSGSMSFGEQLGERLPYWISDASAGVSPRSNSGSGSPLSSLSTPMQQRAAGLSLPSTPDRCSSPLSGTREQATDFGSDDNVADGAAAAPLPSAGSSQQAVDAAPAQFSWLLSFRQPQLERDFVRWQSQHLAQVDATRLLYLLYACGLLLANSLSLGLAVLLRWLAICAAFAVPCLLAHTCPTRYERHREVVLRGTLAACVAHSTAWGRWQAQQEGASAAAWLHYILPQAALLAAASTAAVVRTAVFVPSQLLNMALALSVVGPAMHGWLKFACSLAIMFGLAYAWPAAFTRRRDLELRRQFLADAASQRQRS